MSLKISELKETIKKTGYIDDEIIDKINIKTYIPHIQKSTLVKEISNECLVTDEDNTTKIDYCLMDYIIDCTMVQFYTDIEFDEENDEVDNSLAGNYDYLKESGIVDIIISTASTDYYYLKEKIIDTLEQEMVLSNSIEGILANGINKLLDKLPNDKQLGKIVNKLSKSMENFSPENYKFIQDAINFNNGVK